MSDVAQGATLGDEGEAVGKLGEGTSSAVVF